MKISNYFIFTYKNINSEIKLISNKFLLKSGLISKISNGIYVYFPICFKIIKKIIFFIKKELEKINFNEFLLPLIHPIKIYEISNRITNFKSELFYLKKKFILSPTNEEIFIWIFKNKIKKYNILPINFYQITNKFRNEIRCNSGLIRCKEFLMKDAYTITINLYDLKKIYELIYNTYIHIFNNLFLNYKIFLSKDNSMGGYFSHEFYFTKDFINYNNLFKFSYLLNIINNVFFFKNEFFFLKKKIHFAFNISDLYLFSNYFKINIIYFLKINIFLHNLINNKINFNLLFLKSNFIYKKKIELKVFKFNRVLNFLELNKFFNLNYNYLGYYNKKKIKIFIDKIILNLNIFFISFNKKNYVLNIINNNFFFNFFFYKKKNKKKLEIAHIFQIGDFYSKKFNFKIKNKNNNFKYLLINSYGIGVTRLITSIIEQNYDKLGIIWPYNICPFKIVLCSIGYNYINIVRKFTDKLYKFFIFNNIEIIIDDRIEKIGFILKDWDLLGIPYKIIITEKNLKKKRIEYIYRKYLFSIFLKLNFFSNFFLKKIILNNFY